MLIPFGVGAADQQSYSYDGFCNLTDQTVIAGSAPSMHVVYNAAANRQTTDSADANGNLTSMNGQTYTYDVENRIDATVRDKSCQG